MAASVILVTMPPVVSCAATVISTVENKFQKLMDVAASRKFFTSSKDSYKTMLVLINVMGSAEGGGCGR